MERKRNSGFRRILLIAFLLFLASNPKGQSLTFTKPNLT